MAEQKPLLIVCGPTASGKTALAVRLAKELDGEIVSADSMQIYKGLNIGTAKPSPEEMEGIPHHLLDFLEVDRSFSVADFAELARQAAGEIHSRERLPILAGGTGLYIRAVTDNIQYEEIAGDVGLRAELERIGDTRGNGVLWQMLCDVDPELARVLHPNNRGRIIRGIEVYRTTGTPLSRLQRESRRRPGEYRLCMLGLGFADRSELYRRINLRVDLMVEQGLLQEAEALFRREDRGTAGQAIGYKELFPYFAGERTLEQALEELKMQTRRYAKRQLTWFRREGRIRWLNVDELSREELIAQALRAAREGLGL